MVDERDETASPGGALRIAVVEGPDGTVLALTGRVDAVTAVTLRERVTALDLETATRLRVDLRAVDFLDSAGLAALVQAHRSCGAAGTPIDFVAPRGSAAWRVFDLTRFDEIFDFVAETEGGP
ncbi:STAS domain-containing protein [Microbacterium xanthum]|uniref:STAS domain-containing protein n=1 Tax=Microbacterium xanthum TaxID=3079794 RepID=UPI002AD4F023|nr:MULTISPECIES: STAS domain-containing protein [unclassified Microbacterium]MDZ8171550.1 STAS domain-containing protein [Microbacterium sp. KSW-48]MDZ8200411.1 STAS domain-containing protein [Microbacterium sp. SSW1-59]